MTTQYELHRHDFTMHKLPHIQQRFHWDCGVVCVLMLLSKEQRELFLRNFNQICQEERIDQATWTIDLCYLLKRFNIDHCLYTLRLGINYNCTINNKTISNKDKDRLRKRFENAETDGLKVQLGAYSTEELIIHIQKYGPAIVLVDAKLLSCDLCKKNKLTSELRSVWGGRYCGHYITVVGFLRGKLVYHDPARATTCATSPSRMASARYSNGTDRDVVLVFKHYF